MAYKHYLQRSERGKKNIYTEKTVCNQQHGRRQTFSSNNVPEHPCDQESIWSDFPEGQTCS